MGAIRRPETPVNGLTAPGGVSNMGRRRLRLCGCEALYCCPPGWLRRLPVACGTIGGTVPARCGSGRAVQAPPNYGGHRYDSLKGGNNDEAETAVPLVQ